MFNLKIDLLIQFSNSLFVEDVHIILIEFLKLCPLSILPANLSYLLFIMMEYYVKNSERLSDFRVNPYNNFITTRIRKYRRKMEHSESDSAFNKSDRLQNFIICLRYLDIVKGITDKSDRIQEKIDIRLFAFVIRQE